MAREKWLSSLDFVGQEEEIYDNAREIYTYQDLRSLFFSKLMAGIFFRKKVMATATFCW